MSAYKKRVEAMVRRVSAGGNVALHGGPGTGKSYTANVLADTLAGQFAMPCVRLDLSTASSGAEVFKVIANSIGANVSASASLHDAWAAMQGAGQVSTQTTCIVLDEFDSVAKFADNDLFLRHLRELVHNTTHSRICAVVASRRNLRVIEEAVRGISTLEGVFAPYYLSTLGKTDIESGWELGELSAPAWSGCLEWSGGVPRLVDLFLSSNVELTMESPEAELGRQQWIERQLDYIDMVGLTDATAQYVLGPIIRRDPAAKAQLLAMGVIGDPREGYGPPLATFDVFVSSLRARHETTMSAWGALGAAEVAARRLIRATLESIGAASGDVAKLHNYPPEVREILQRGKMELDSLGIASFSLSSVVAAVRRGDYWRIMDALWDTVGSTMSPPDRNYWRLRLCRLGGVGWSPGQEWEVDDQEFGQWAEEIAGGQVPNEHRRPRTSASHGASGANITITAGERSIIGIGETVTNTSKVRQPNGSGTERGHSLLGRRVPTVIGTCAGLATIASLIYYIIDR